MDGEILPLGLVRDRAQQAADEGRDHHASPWPIGTAAGQLFVREFHAARAKAAASKRVISYGLEEEEIAKRLGRSKPYIADLLRLAGAGKAIKEMVAAGQVNAANAIKVLKKAKTDSQAAETLRTKLEAAKSRGKGKVTAATLAPKRDLLSEGIAWLSSNGDASNRDDLADFLAFLTGASLDDISRAMRPSPDRDGGRHA